MHILSRFNKPEYFYRPTQILRAIRSGRLKDNLEAIVKTPWGLPLAVDPRETIGYAILCLGIYDLSVSEALCRLLDRGDNAIDVGANIGYMSSLMVAKVGVTGSVESFEPHPELYARFRSNTRRWRYRGINRVLTIVPAALSSQDGTATLGVPEEFMINQGLASLERFTESKGIVVTTQRLDSAVTAKNIALVKIDVEGHELQVLRGAERLLANHQIRDIVFEEENNYPTRTTEYLEKYDYKIYGLGMTFRGPVIAGGRLINEVPRREWEPKSLLATCAKERAEDRFRPGGWSVLRTISIPYGQDPDDPAF
jgi:FkbM family methyltransferase